MRSFSTQRLILGQDREQYIYTIDRALGSEGLHSDVAGLCVSLLAILVMCLAKFATTFTKTKLTRAESMLLTVPNRGTFNFSEFAAYNFVLIDHLLPWNSPHLNKTS